MPVIGQGSANFDAMNIVAAATNCKKYVKVGSVHEHWVSSTHLELTLLDAQLAEEPVHDVAGQEKDIGVAVLVHAHL